jgi:HAD superfamily hydrolase (TIGR01484 family)
MLPFSACPAAALGNIEGVLTDIDDTLTTDGRLTADVLAAMEALRARGIKVIPVTGRPFGWTYPLARLWPVDAVIAENGAAYTYVDIAQRQQIVYYTDDATRAAHRARLMHAMAKVAQALPHIVPAQDNFARVGDVAFDVAENVPRLDNASVKALVALLKNAGLRTAVSSIHAHGWVGEYDKCTMSLRCLAEVFNVDAARAKARWAFIGDSMNDAPMFGYFDLSVGVANVRAFETSLPHLPRYITQASHGAGFIEFANLLLLQPVAAPNIN